MDIVKKAGYEGMVITDKCYHSPLPKELEKHYAYIEGCGHSIICVPADAYEEGKPIGDYLVAVPVKYVLREGWKIKKGYVWIEVEYSRELGLRTPIEDYEF